MNVFLFALACLALLWWMGCSEPDAIRAGLLDVEVSYVEDGAGGSVPELIQEPAVRALLRRPDIQNELVSHIDSTEMTRARFRGQPVAIGYICLDILLNTIGPAQQEAVLLDYADDGLWSTVRDAYYYPPDAYRRRGGRAKMRAVKTAWEQLLAQQKH